MKEAHILHEKPWLVVLAPEHLSATQYVTRNHDNHCCMGYDCLSGSAGPLRASTYSSPSVLQRWIAVSLQFWCCLAIGGLGELKKDSALLQTRSAEIVLSSSGEPAFTSTADITQPCSYSSQRWRLPVKAGLWSSYYSISINGLETRACHVSVTVSAGPPRRGSCSSSELCNWV